MNDLLAFALDAHGGLARWERVRSIEAEVAVGGALWSLKGQADLFAQGALRAETDRQHIRFDRPGGGALVYTPDRVWAEDAGGRPIAERHDPAAPFAGQTQASPWDALQAAFFNGRALWTYLTQPFLYARPGFQLEEVEPVRENGETWRSLRVTFPADIDTHARVQTTRFGPDGLIRRHDYAVDILGGAQGANYAEAYRIVDGLAAPLRRRVFPRADTGEVLPEPLLVSIDLAALRFGG